MAGALCEPIVSTALVADATAAAALEDTNTQVAELLKQVQALTEKVAAQEAAAPKTKTTVSKAE